MNNAPAEDRLRVGAVVRDVQQTLVTADTRSELEQEVCETLAASDHYEFAWIGDREAESEEFTVRAAAGIDADGIENIGFGTGRPQGSDEGPTAALVTGNPQITRNVDAPTGEEPWQDQAGIPSFSARAAIPLQADDRVLGTLTVYSARAGAFHESERQLLVDLGETIAAAIENRVTRAELASSKRKYERLTERISDAYFAVDSDWRITYWNEQMASRAGRPAVAVLGEQFWEVFPAYRETALEEHYREAMATQEPHSFEYHFEEEDYWVSIDVYPDEDGISVFSRDITERKEYERRLKEQRDDLEILNQVVRHDIRNDLQLISAYAELLGERVDDDELEYVETISRRARTAVELTQSARSLAAVMLQNESETEPMPLRRTLETQLEETRATYPGAAITLADEIPDVSVRGNELLSSVFRNILKNAVQHNDEDLPTVQVSVELDDDAVTISIADNGPGVPDERKEEIFGKGEKGLESGGTGVGLYLVGTLVESYGGEVRVTDNDPEGANFAVTLPIAE